MYILLPSTIMMGFGTVRELTRVDLVEVVVVVLWFGTTVVPVLVADVTSGPTMHAFSID